MTTLLKFVALAAIAISTIFGALADNNDQALDRFARASFSIGFQGVSSNLPILTTSIMPSDKLRVRAEADLSVNSGTVARDGDDWVWTAPAEPGRYVLNFERGGETITLNVFALTPFRNGEQTSLNGYKIGTYTKKLFRGLQSYAEPKGFIDLSHGPSDLKISPNFTLGQFICKQQPGYDPAYLLIRPGMLIKLETLLEAANEKGWRADTFHVMSGFRTPFYNASIGNRTTSSRHLYGGAADIWIDHDGDGKMDDLNRDGIINKDDARTLAALASSLADKGGPGWPSGGIGVYGANAAHGPFVHVDARGYAARWGQ